MYESSSLQNYFSFSWTNEHDTLIRYIVARRYFVGMGARVDDLWVNIVKQSEKHVRKVADWKNASHGYLNGTKIAVSSSDIRMIPMKTV